MDGMACGMGGDGGMDEMKGMEGLQEGVIYSESDIARFRRQAGLVDSNSNEDLGNHALTKRERERADELRLRQDLCAVAARLARRTMTHTRI